MKANAILSCLRKAFQGKRNASIIIEDSVGIPSGIQDILLEVLKNRSAKQIRYRELQNYFYAVDMGTPRHFIPTPC